MKSLKWILPMVVIAIMLGGCPYKSDIALDTTGKKINPALLGKWELRSSTSNTYTISKDNDFTYRILKSSTSSKDTSVYKAYIVDVDGDSFLNLWEDNQSSEKAYYFYKVELNPATTKVTLAPVTENITEKFKTGEEMKAFFKKYKGLSFFFDKSQDTYIKD